MPTHEKGSFAFFDDRFHEIYGAQENEAGFGFGELFRQPRFGGLPSRLGRAPAFFDVIEIHRRNFNSRFPELLDHDPAYVAFLRPIPQNSGLAS